MYEIFIFKNFLWVLIHANFANQNNFKEVFKSIPLFSQLYVLKKSKIFIGIWGRGNSFTKNTKKLSLC